jgi:Flp pilus assembly protein TadD
MLVPARGAAAAPQVSPASPDPAQIERRLKESAKTAPESFAAHHALAGFYLERGDVESAIPHLRRAYAIDPAHPVNGYNLGLALLQTGALDDARKIVMTLLKAQESGELHNLLGDIEESDGNLIGAAEEFQKAAHMDATEEHLFDWGNNLLRLRSADNALNVFGVSVQRYPDSARLHIGLGIAQYSRGRYKDAVTSFCRAVDLDPSDPRPYGFLGDIYGVAPDLGPEVTERLAGFVKAQPKNALAHLYYALSLWKGQRASADSPPVDLKRVEALLNQAATLDPALGRAFLELGILLSDQGRHKEAIDYLLTATRLEPSHAQARYRLAQAYRRTGQTALAEKQLEIFQKLKADGP